MKTKGVFRFEWNVKKAVFLRNVNIRRAHAIYRFRGVVDWIFNQSLLFITSQNSLCYENCGKKDIKFRVCQSKNNRNNFII